MTSKGILRRRIAVIALLVVSLATPVIAQSASPRLVKVTLLQVNDVYQISPVDNGARGGLARLATLRKQIAGQSPNALFLLAGDTLAPSVASNIFKGRQMIAAWNAAGLDYAVLGNHEFDFGDAILRERMKESQFVWLAANVIDKKTGKPFGDTPPYVIREFDGVKVGLFGLLTPETANASKPGPDVEFLDPFETAARIVPRIRDAGAKVIVALTHLSMTEDKRLARAASIDVIIGGHEHTLLESLSGRTPIFKMGSDARTLGRIDLNIDAASGTLESVDWEEIPVTNAVAEDPACGAVIAGFEKRLSAELDNPVGKTSVVLDALQATNRSRETNLGDFLADAYRKTSGADVAILNGGSIRSNTTYGPGVLTKRNVLSILPYENPIVKMEVTGTILRAALEHGVSKIAVEQEAGRFLQVSGLRFEYDARRPPGSRVVNVSLNGQPLDDNKKYTVATNSYLAGGGDGFAMFSGARYLITPVEGPVEPAVVMNALAAVSEIAPQVDGRIKRLDH